MCSGKKTQLKKTSARPEGRRPRGRRLHIQTGEISALSERRWHCHRFAGKTETQGLGWVCVRRPRNQQWRVSHGGSPNSERAHAACSAEQLSKAGTHVQAGVHVSLLLLQRRRICWNTYPTKRVGSQRLESRRFPRVRRAHHGQELHGPRTHLHESRVPLIRVWRLHRAI